MHSTTGPTSKRAGLLLGLGLGASLDGILLHQIAQWHNMGSAVLPPTTIEAMQRNMTWDGLFHAATWVAILAGVLFLYADGRKSRRGESVPEPMAFAGLLVMGWGLFNLIEGIIDHHILELHHVRDMPVHIPIYDWLFLGVGGVGLILVGWIMWRHPFAHSSSGLLHRSPAA